MINIISHPDNNKTSTADNENIQYIRFDDMAIPLAIYNIETFCFRLRIFGLRSMASCYYGACFPVLFLLQIDKWMRA